MERDKAHTLLLDCSYHKPDWIDVADLRGQSGADHDRRVSSLPHAYADLLAQHYATDLGAMEWYILRKYLNDPVIA